MYLAGVSVRRVEDITEALWGTRVSPSTVWPRTQGLLGQKGGHRGSPAGRRGPSRALILPPP
jgi:hypothetical protein